MLPRLLPGLTLSMLGLYLILCQKLNLDSVPSLLLFMITLSASINPMGVQDLIIAKLYPVLSRQKLGRYIPGQDLKPATECCWLLENRIESRQSLSVSTGLRTLWNVWTALVPVWTRQRELLLHYCLRERLWSCPIYHQSLAGYHLKLWKSRKKLGRSSTMERV